MTGRPVLLMIAGPNGSGKSTLTRQLQAQGFDLGIYVNADEIAAELGDDEVTRTRRAQAIAEDRRQECLASRTSFSFETVMSHPSKVALLEQARALGFYNVLYFVATEDPELNVARVRQRVALGGHSVPEDRIVARYQRTLALLPKAVASCDRSVLFDNTYRATTSSHVRMTPFCEIEQRSEGLVLAKIVPPVPSWAVSLTRALRRAELDRAP
jgi:predicted ABC-type ATPase